MKYNLYFHCSENTTFFFTAVKYIEDINFVEVNTKIYFIECGEKNQYFSRVRSVIMFDVDVTTCVALFLTNIFHLKPYVKKSQSQNCQENLVLLQFYSILQ